MIGRFGKLTTVALRNRSHAPFAAASKTTEKSAENKSAAEMARIDMPRGRSPLDSLVDSLEYNSKGVQYGLYGLGITGVIVAFRRVRPFQKFSRPTDVPRSFIQKKEPLLGIVKAAELKNGAAVLQVSHSPPVTMGREGKPPYLPVSLFGVTPTVNGLSWLQIVLNSQHVQFTVLSTDLNSAKSLVTFNGLDVGTRLVELGFARVVPPEQALSSSEALQKLYKRLSKSEKRAERNGNGIWWGQAPLYIKLANRTCSKLRLMAVKNMPAKLSNIVALR